MKFALLAFCLIFSTLAQASSKKVVIVQMVDGVGFEQLEKIAPLFLRKHNITPLKPGNPSVTFPALATFATGVSAAQHGVFSNKLSPREYPFIKTDEDQRIYQTLANRLRVPPIWLFAKNQGTEVFIYQWAMADNKWCGHVIRDNPEQIFDTEVGVPIAVATDAVLEKLNSWDKKKDLLIYSYSHGLDKVGHAKGPYAQETVNEWQRSAKILENYISKINAFKTKTKSEVSLFIVSDHGMYENWMNSAIDVNSYFAFNGYPETMNVTISPKQIVDVW